MPIQGLRTDENFLTTQRPQNWRQTMLLLYPNSSDIAKAPLTALTSLMKSESTDDPVFHWFQKTLDARRFLLAANIAPADTSITIDPTFQTGTDFATAKMAKAGDVLWVEQTGEILRVSADPSTNNVIPVSRAQAGTPAGTVTITAAGTNTYVNIIGSAMEEGSLAPTSVNYDPIELNNYCQIFRSTLSITRTAQKTRLRTGDAVTEAKRECLEYFSIDMERAFWFNARKQLTSVNGNPARFTAGVLQQIKDGAPQNVLAAPPGGLITMDWLEQNTELLFRFGSSEKMAFGSNLALLALQQAIRKNSFWRIESGIKEYGLTVSRFITPFGELVFKTHPLFNQMQGGTTAGSSFYSVANNVYILDMQNIRYKYVDDVMYEKDLTPIGLDGLKSGYKAECGLELHHAQSHGVWLGLIGGDTDS
jgi:Family of unknown function (DUF5309)